MNRSMAPRTPRNGGTSEISRSPYLEVAKSLSPLLSSHFLADVRRYFPDETLKNHFFYKNHNIYLPLYYNFYTFKHS